MKAGGVRLYAPAPRQRIVPPPSPAASSTPGRLPHHDDSGRPPRRQRQFAEVRAGLSPRVGRYSAAEDCGNVPFPASWTDAGLRARVDLPAGDSDRYGPHDGREPSRQTRTGRLADGTEGGDIASLPEHSAVSSQRRTDACSLPMKLGPARHHSNRSRCPALPATRRSRGGSGPGATRAGFGPGDRLPEVRSGCPPPGAGRQPIPGPIHLGCQRSVRGRWRPGSKPVLPGGLRRRRARSSPSDAKSRELRPAPGT